MARLTETEKAQLVAAARREVPRPPKLALRPGADVVAFATFASRIKLVTKPVRFGGTQWKL